uniref:Polyprotein n=1 Tax=Bemisia tabaci beny-like virus 1 TaxID=2840008 RepID=A0A8E8FTS2_9VIRU|nr:polyprotein [Bemisia tabaci beny-like virus 1]
MGGRNRKNQVKNNNKTKEKQKKEKQKYERCSSETQHSDDEDVRLNLQRVSLSNLVEKTTPKESSKVEMAQPALLRPIPSHCVPRRPGGGAKTKTNRKPPVKAAGRSNSDSPVVEDIMHSMMLKAIARHDEKIAELSKRLPALSNISGLRGDCWQKIFSNPEIFYDEDDYVYTRYADRQVELNEVKRCDDGGGVYKVLSPRARSIPELILMIASSFKPGGAIIKPYCECVGRVADCALCETKSINDSMRRMMNMNLQFSASAFGVLHLRGYTCGPPKDLLDGEFSFCYMTLLLMCVSKRAFEDLFPELRADRLLPAHPEHPEVYYKLDMLANYVIGIEAEQMIEECKRLHTAELARSHAQSSFAADVRSVPKVDIRLSDSEKLALKSYLGFAVMSNNKHISTSDHKFLQVSRELLRRTLRSMFPESTDVASVLHIGCTMYEVKSWRANIGHDFLLGIHEDKDIGRIYDSLVAEVGKVMGLKKSRNVNSSAVTIRTVNYNGLQDLLRFLNAAYARDKVFTEMPEKRYGTLMFEDSLYDINEDTFLDYFRKTGATTAYATLFIPDGFLTDTPLRSEIYDLEEYYDTDLIVEHWLPIIWPQICVITPWLPWNSILTTVHNIFHWLSKKGMHIVIDWITNLPNADFPIEEVTGVAFDVIKFGPIIQAISKALRQYLRDNYMKVRVNWKGGFDAGYNHKWHCWRKWISTRRIVGKDGLCVDWAVHERVGEMYLLRFYKSSGTSDMVYSLQLPVEKVVVMVADIQSAWSPTRKVLGEMSYFPVLAKNWYQLYNWAMAEPVESLDFSVMLTTLNRVRGGLSLNSNVLVEAMKIQDTETVKIALACLMEVFKNKGVLADINNVKENLISYKTNLEILMRTLAAAAVNICTAGLAIPAVYLLKWLFDANPAYVFVKELVKPKVTTVKARKNPGTPRKILFSAPASHVFDVKSEGYDPKCMLCKCQASGLFSKTTPDLGQQFVCHVKKPNNTHVVEIKQAELIEIAEHLTAAKEYHASSPNIIKAISETKLILEANSNGISRELDIDFITGGPGTGKSVVIRELAAMMEDSGSTVSIIVPFSNLRAEYTNADMLRAPQRTFNVMTPYHALAAPATDVLIVDEATAVPWQLLYGLLVKSGPKHLILVGDKNQTKLNSKQGEGLDILSYNLEWDKIRTHEMIWNYRLDQWRVKFLNNKYGYKMRTRRLDACVPIVLSITDYKTKLSSGNLSIDRELVFSHSSSEGTFGYISSASKIGDVQNHSIRTSQGMTFDNVAVSYSTADVSVANTHGMLCVAISRARYNTVFVVHTTDDSHVQALKDVLCVGSESAINEISSMNFPDITNDYVVPDVSNPRLDRLIDDKLINSQITDTSVGDVEQRNLETGSTITTNSRYETPTDDLFEFYGTVFHMCIPNMLISAFSHIEDARDIIIREITDIYLDDARMCRKKSGTASKPLKRKDGKFMLPLVLVTKIFSQLPGAVLFSEQGIVLASGGDTKFFVSFFQLNGEHVEPYSRHYVRIPIMYAGELRVVEHATTMIDGKFVGQYTPTSGKRTDYFRVPDSANIETEEYTDQDFMRFTPIPECAGYELKRFHYPEKMSHIEKKVVQTHTPVMSSYYNTDTVVESELRQNKLRLGKDAYKLGRLIDPSGAVQTPCLNYAAPFLGPKCSKNIVIRWEGFIFDKTKAGKLLLRKDKKYRAVAPGMANHYNNSPEETLIAAQRIAGTDKKPALTGESKAFCIRVAEKAFETHFSKITAEDWTEYNTIFKKAFADIKSRNYFSRANKENPKFKKWVLKFHNKDQVKPIKNDNLDLSKGGQGILQTPAAVNLEFVTWMRVLNKMFFDAKQSHFHYDNLTPTQTFRRELTKSIANMPNSAQIAIVDARSFDSQQSQVTLEIERQFLKILGAKMDVLEKYYDFRAPMPYSCFGKFSGYTSGEKGSGFPDTLLGNTILQTCLATYALEGKGPMCVASKGDDHLRIQSGIKVNESKLKEIKLYTNIVLDISIGQGGEFCGDTITPIGAFPSINRAAVKTIAMRAKNYEEFAEKQQSLRDKIKEYQDCGIEECVAYTSRAENVNTNNTWASLAFVNSMSHINKAQWLGITRKFHKARFYLPTATGPTII